MELLNESYNFILILGGGFAIGWFALSTYRKRTKKQDK